MKNLFSPKLVAIYFTIFLLVSTLDFFSMAGVLYEGDTSHYDLKANSWIVDQESRPVYPNAKYINDTYLRDFNIFLDHNSFALITWFLMIPGSFLFTLIGLIVNFRRSKNKTTRILLLILICLVLAPLIIDIVSKVMAPYLTKKLNTSI